MKKIIYILYTIFLFSFLLFSYAFVDPNIIYFKNIYTGFAFNNKSATTLFFTLTILLYFVFYFAFLKLWKKNNLELKDIQILIGMTIVILFLSYPAMLSYDIFNYIATAKVTFFYRENPYIIMPIEFLGEPLLSFTRASNKLALYGHFWILLSGIPYTVGFGNFLLTLFSFKLFIILFYLGTILFIYKLSKNIYSVLFFALNPLIIIEILVSAHNDIVMMFFILLAYWLMLKKKLLFSLIFLFFSIFIKYATVFLLPIFLYIVLRQYYFKKEINYEKIFYISIFLMMTIFFLSPIREEIYPWYAIWFLTFIALCPERKIIIMSSIIFSLSLLLRYIPYMFSATYNGLTPVIKTFITFTPSVLFSIYYVLKKKI